jgi:hypothetical protein
VDKKYIQGAEWEMIGRLTKEAIQLTTGAKS